MIQPNRLIYLSPAETERRKKLVASRKPLGSKENPFAAGTKLEVGQTRFSSGTPASVAKSTTATSGNRKLKTSRPVLGDFALGTSAAERKKAIQQFEATGSFTPTSDPSKVTVTPGFTFFDRDKKAPTAFDIAGDKADGTATKTDSGTLTNWAGWTPPGSDQDALVRGEGETTIDKFGDVYDSEGNLIYDASTYTNPDVSAARGRATEIALNIGKDVPGFKTDIAATTVERAQDLVASQAADVEFEKANEARLKKYEATGLRNLVEKLDRNVSAAAAAFGPGRSGQAYTGARAALPQAFAEGGAKIIDVAKQQIEINQARRKRALEKATEARQNGMNELAMQFQAEAEMYQKKIIAEQDKADEKIGKLEMQQQELAETKLGTVLDLGDAAVATMTPDVLGQYFTAAGYDPATAGGVILAAQKMEEARKSKDAMALKNATADYNAKVYNLKTGAQRDVEQLNYLDEQLAAGEITQSVYDHLKAGLGAGQKPLTPGEEIELARETRELYGDTSLPTQSNEGITTTVDDEGGISINLPEDYTKTGRHSGDFKNGDGVYCAEFVNDYWGLAAGSRLGNSYAEKAGFINKGIKDPVPGMAFITQTNMPEGHTGIVLKNYGNGMIKVTDFNKDGKSGQKSVYDMSIQDVFNKGGGFGANPNAAAATTDKEATLLTNTEQKNAQTWGVAADKKTTFGSLGEVEQILVNYDRTKKDDLKKATQDIVFWAAQKGLETKEDGEALVQILQGLNYSEAMITKVFKEADKNDVFNADYKDGKVKLNWL